MTRTPTETVLDVATAGLVARALHIVAELGVADALDDQPRSAADLAADCDAEPDSLDRLLRLLEAQGVFAADGTGRWRHNEASRSLRSDHPTSLRAFARMLGLPFVWDSMTHLEHTARTGQPGVSLLDPPGMWEYLRANPEQAAIFDEAMTGKAHGDVAAVLAAHDFSTYERVADVGGGRGHLLAAILALHERPAGVLFDLPQVADQVPATPRMEVVAGDFFADPLPVCDCYALMNILHDWPDKEASAILGAVANAGRSNEATVLVVETLLPEDSQPHWAKVLDVLMLSVTGGRERTGAGYQALLDGAGIDVVEITPTATPFSIIVGRVRKGART